MVFEDEGRRGDFRGVLGADDGFGGVGPCISELEGFITGLGSSGLGTIGYNGSGDDGCFSKVLHSGLLMLA